MLENKTAIITGSSRGLGKSIAWKLAKEGMNVTIVGRSSDIHEVAEELTQAGYRALACQADVSEESDVEAFVEATLKQFGSIDTLVNNAGVGLFKYIEDITLEEWQRLFNINVQGVFLCSKAVVPHMKEREEGTIITISSDVGRRTMPKGTAYTATKYAVQAFSGSLAQEVREYGIRVGTINPGMIDTYFNQSKQGEPHKEDWLKADDVADAVVYMASAPKHVVIDEMMLHPLIQEYPRV
ncbi:SDR family oxidoreductase [Desertibacillus haloalkaliphilus]|uniref:SDR family oxidoreductase n=1 Tax=Desertibacillus haloalkaliphilus TaxID=1328930 RepID=UPI001C27DC56|nr:SDR family oxidoreductase [Desertibacillus haloalkaliphilus]MBU8904985.1 SDR family oxidoreductase [Desertibacillus haloalkaliphilus]